MIGFKRVIVVFIVILIALCLKTEAAEKKGTFSSACVCTVNETGEPCKGEYRWAIKTDRMLPLKSITDVTPSEIGKWKGPGEEFQLAKRTGKETNWYRVTGKVKEVKAEPDGDLHILLVDEDGKSNVNVVVEVPLGDMWCNIRKLVFGWADVKFPLHRKTLTLIKEHVVSVVGKAFYDGKYAEKEMKSNRRKKSVETTIWEIHPVMELTEK
jgi:hypothetical protein